VTPKQSGAVAIVQARIGSSRFPAKVLQPLGDTTVLGYLLRRLGRSKRLNAVRVAVPESDGELIAWLEDGGHPYALGSEKDVLARVYHAAREASPEHVVRVTADCPLVDPQLVDVMLQRLVEESLDYVGFGMRPTYPDGLGTEVFRFEALEQAFLHGERPEDREHVTWYVRTHPELYRLGEHHLLSDHGHVRFTVDYPEDLQVVRGIVERLEHERPDFGVHDILRLYERAPEVWEPVRHIRVRDATGPNPIDYSGSGGKDGV